MNFKEINQVIESIAATSGAKAKKKIIAANISDPDFQRVVKYALDQSKHYNLTDLPEPNGVTVGDIFKHLDYLASKRGATQGEAQVLADLCAMEDGAREVVTKIIRKDLRCGAKAKTFNGVVRDLVYEIPYQRYKSPAHIDGIDFSGNIVVQKKMDGMFAYHSRGKFITRNGLSFDFGTPIADIPDAEDELFEKFRYSDAVFMGELLVEVDGEFLPRQESNGIINSFISGEGDPYYVPSVVYVVWGCVTHTEFTKKVSNTPYFVILRMLQEIKSLNNNSQIRLIGTVKVATKEEAIEKYMELRESKAEGAMVKDIDKLTWRDQQSGSPYGVKLKAVVEGEFEIVEAYYGDPNHKWAAYLGGLVVKSSCGGILTRVGTGYSDDQRLKGVDWWNEQKGKIVTNAFNDIVTDESDRETMCLSHGRFVEDRFNEKTEADSMEYLMEELANA